MNADLDALWCFDAYLSLGSLLIGVLGDGYMCINVDMYIYLYAPYCLCECARERKRDPESDQR